MSGNLQDRPFLLLLLRVMRTMLLLCAGTVVLVGGVLLYSITSVQGRGLDSLTSGETVGLSLILAMVIVCLVLFLAAGRILRQNAAD